MSAVSNLLLRPTFKEFQNRPTFLKVAHFLSFNMTERFDESETDKLDCVYACVS